MAVNFRVELNSDQIEALLKSADVGKMVGTVAKKAASRAGSGYTSDTYVVGGPNGRAVAGVIADSKDAIIDNLDNNTLLKVVQS